MNVFLYICFVFWSLYFFFCDLHICLNYVTWMFILIVFFYCDAHFCLIDLWVFFIYEDLNPRTLRERWYFSASTPYFSSGTRLWMKLRYGRHGLPFPSPGDLPNPGIEPGSPALQADALTSEPLGWVDFPFSRGSSQLRDRTQVSHIAGRFFTSWATREAHRLGLPWYWIVCLGNEQRHSVVFEIASEYCILDSLVGYDGYSISSKGFLPTVVDIMVIWVKFNHPSLF